MKLVGELLQWFMLQVKQFILLSKVYGVLLEVFVDTFIVCTITSLVVIVTGEWSSGVESATLTLNAFSTGLGVFGTYFLTITTLVFGLTTSSGWYVYYEVVLRHLCNKNIKLKNTVLKIFKYFYPLPGLINDFIYPLCWRYKYMDIC